MISVIFGVLFTFGMIFGVGVIAGDPMALIDLITLGVVIGLSLIGTIFSSMAKPRSKLFANFGNFSVIAGWIAFLMGATIISGSMDLGDLKNLGPALAVALLAPLYGYTLKFCCMIGETYFSLDSPEEASEQESPKTRQEIEVGNAGLVFPSPNGTKYSVGVDDSGNIRTRSV